MTWDDQPNDISLSVLSHGETLYLKSVKINGKNINFSAPLKRNKNWRWDNFKFAAFEESVSEEANSKNHLEKANDALVKALDVETAIAERKALADNLKDVHDALAQTLKELKD